MKYRFRIILFFIISFIKIYGQGPYFFKGRDFGSESLYNPIYLILNGGFDMVQVNRSRDIKKIPFYSSSKNVLKNLSNPFQVIKNYGWSNFLSDQVIPLGLSKENGQWWPNYTLHLIGGGMTYTAIKEWFEYYNYSNPKLLSIVSMAAYHWVNEITENSYYDGDNVDPIADIYLFDVGGIILFSFDSVNKFFSEELNLADWSLQPSFSLDNLNLHNNGQFFSIKWKFPFSHYWYLFYYFGTNGVGGLSYKNKDGSSISVGVGMAAKDLILLNKNTNKQTLDLVWNIGIFYDKDNSLLTSLSISKKTDYSVNFNLYPGIIKISRFSPGFWFAYGKKNNFIIGITFSYLPINFAFDLK